MSDAGDLANLRDLALPAQIPFWPPVAGVWIVAGAALAMLAIVLWRGVERYRAAAYKRAALEELRAIGIEDPDFVERVSAILKRVAMVGYGRAQVASLTGRAWADFIADKGPGFDTGPLRQHLANVYDARHAADASERQQVVAQAMQWVRARPVSIGMEAR